VIGVVKDYNYRMPGNPFEPMAIFHSKNDQLFGGGTQRYLVARIDGKTSDGWENTLALLETTYKKKAGDFPFEYTFVGQAFAITVKGERNFAITITAMDRCVGFAGNDSVCARAKDQRNRCSQRLRSIRS
jgi:hypothetical protein